MAYHWMDNAAIMEKADELKKLILEGRKKEAEEAYLQFANMMMKADSEQLRAEGVDTGRVCTVCGCKEVFQDTTDLCCWKNLKKSAFLRKRQEIESRRRVQMAQIKGRHRLGRQGKR